MGLSNFKFPSKIPWPYPLSPSTTTTTTTKIKISDSPLKISFWTLICLNITKKLTNLEKQLIHQLKCHTTWHKGRVPSVFHAKNLSFTYLNPSRPDPGRREKINLTFYFHTSLRLLKRSWKSFVNIFFNTTFEAGRFNKQCYITISLIVSTNIPNSRH